MAQSSFYMRSRISLTLNLCVFNIYFPGFVSFGFFVKKENESWLVCNDLGKFTKLNENKNQIPKASRNSIDCVPFEFIEINLNYHTSAHLTELWHYRLSMIILLNFFPASIDQFVNFCIAWIRFRGNIHQQNHRLSRYSMYILHCPAHCANTHIYLIESGWCRQINTCLLRFFNHYYYMIPL